MGRKLRELYDVVVVGGGPAGAAGALRAAQGGARVLVVEREKFPRVAGWVEWLGPTGVGLCKQCRLSAKKVGASPFKGLRLLSWDLRRSTTVDDPELRGWLVDRATFDHALLREATRRGAEALFGVAVEDVSLGEDRVVLRVDDGREVSGKVLLIADGVDSPTGRMANLACAGQQPAVPQGVSVQYEVDETATRLDVAVGASRVGQVATILRWGSLVRVVLVTREMAVPIGQQFRAFCDEALKRGLLSGEFPEEWARVPCPGGVALDMDAHVGKRCLLIGDAGGFVGAFSGERIYPAMRSGWGAAEAARRALQAPVLQDELASFGVTWRQELADYLRMPNTDLSLLVPLVFNNEHMSRRVARAFLLGQPF